MLDFKIVSTPEDIKATAALAKMIWNEWFVDIIGQAQTDYMVERFQSEKAMTEQISNGYTYYNFMLDGEPIGYFGICQEKDNTLFLSKLYLKQSHRGKGYASKAFKFIKDIAKKNGNTMIWLTVNKHNENAIRVYNKFGMTNVREQITDIGSGFVMDDYVFEYTL